MGIKDDLIAILSEEEAELARFLEASISKLQAEADGIIASRKADFDQAMEGLEEKMALVDLSACAKSHQTAAELESEEFKDTGVILSEDLRRLFVVTHDLGEAAAEVLRNAQKQVIDLHGQDHEEADAIIMKLKEEVVQAQKNHSIVSRYFWKLVRKTNAAITEMPQIALADDWRIFGKKSEEQSEGECDCPACRLAKGEIGIGSLLSALGVGRIKDGIGIPVF